MAYLGDLAAKEFVLDSYSVDICIGSGGPNLVPVCNNWFNAYFIQI